MLVAKAKHWVSKNCCWHGHMLLPALHATVFRLPLWSLHAVSQLSAQTPDLVMLKGCIRSTILLAAEMYLITFDVPGKFRFAFVSAIEIRQSQ